MKFNLIVDENQGPSVTVVCNRVTSVVEKIERLCKELDDGAELIYGYSGDEVTPLELALAEKKLYKLQQLTPLSRLFQAFFLNLWCKYRVFLNNKESKIEKTSGSVVKYLDVFIKTQ